MAGSQQRVTLQMSKQKQFIVFCFSASKGVVFEIHEIKDVRAIVVVVHQIDLIIITFEIY